MPTTKAPARMTKSIDCLTHETAGTARAKTSASRTSRRLRKKIEMLFAHLKRILKLDRLRLRGPNANNVGHLWRPPMLSSPLDLELKQGRLQYFTKGDGPVIVVHGWGFNANLWRRVFDVLSRGVLLLCA